MSTVTVSRRPGRHLSKSSSVDDSLQARLTSALDVLNAQAYASATNGSPTERKLYSTRVYAILEQIGIDIERAGLKTRLFSNLLQRLAGDADKPNRMITFAILKTAIDDQWCHLVSTAS